MIELRWFDKTVYPTDRQNELQKRKGQPEIKCWSERTLQYRTVENSLEVGIQTITPLEEGVQEPIWSDWVDVPVEIEE